MSDQIYYLGFSVFPGIGPQKFSLLLNHFGSAKAAWEAETNEKQKVIGEKLTEKFEAFRKTFYLDKYVESVEKKKVDFVTLAEKEYPELLKQLKNPPFVLYVRGEKGLLQPPVIARNEMTKQSSIEGDCHDLIDIESRNDKRYIAVVGTRRITSYGETVTRLFTESLVASDCVIVSGLALGVDAVAHKTTIDTNGKTIAVLGSGVDNCFPRENQRIYDEIISSGGAIVSEYPLGQEPTIGSFPSRNRIIAGLSDAVLVTEGAEDSGALITADHALEIGRKAFAIPGPITSSLSKGPYKLLKKGGVLVTSPEELLEELGLKNIKNQSVTTAKKVVGETKEEQMIIDLLMKEPLMIDQLVRLTELSSSEIGTTLSLMELKGFITLQNGYYTII